MDFKLWPTLDSDACSFFVSELWTTKFSGLVALPKGFPKISTFRVGDPPNFGKSGPKFQTFNPHISYPKGFWGEILVWGDRGPMGLLKFRKWGT